METRKGFTLIELLVVIAIIALLMAMVMPALRKAKEAAKMVICSSNQHQIITGIGAYASDNDSRMPPAVARGGRPSVLNRHQDNTSVYYTVGSYLPIAKVFNCPVSSFADFDVDLGFIKASYQYLYENPQDTDINPNAAGNSYIDCSYQLLWNYKFNPDPSVSDRPFVGPGKDSDVKLLTSDAFYFSGALYSSIGQNNTWTSTHNFKTSNAKLKNNQWYPFKYFEGGTRSLADFDSTSALQEVRLNAGYTDGSVVRFNSGDTVKVGRHSGWASYRFPTQWY